jgi:glycosyltransferase involved in cell wall biosynthesis
MKILTILTYYHPHWTGLTAIAKRIAEGLVARGHQVTVLTTRHDSRYAGESTESGVRVIRLRPAARLSRGLFAPALVPVAARVMAMHDVVQIHSPLPEAAIVGALCRARRRPLLMTHQGDLVMPAGLANQVVQLFGDIALNTAARLAARITTNSFDYAEHSAFLQRHRDKVVPIHPPVELPEPDLEAARAWRRGLGLEGKLLVGFAGRFVEEKGFDYLLRSVPTLLSSLPNIHLVYAGEHRVVYETFYERCRRLVDDARDSLTFVGLIHDRQRLANFYGMCDAFVLPSRTDCFAAVQVEAMLSGTPVVASDIAGAREVVSLTGMGLLVSPRDPDALAAGIVELLRDRELRTKPRAEIRAVFDPDRSIAEYESLLADLAGRAS